VTTDWERYLESLAAFGMRPGLERVSALLDGLGRPQDAYRVVHVVGTNGKSSTTRYAAALLGAHGLRAGAYLSPHLTGFCERVVVDGRPIGEQRFGGAVEVVRAAVARLPAELGDTTQFEVLTVGALLALAEESVEAVALEAGLGGRLDATNVVAAPVVVLTNIGLEHTDVLGGTREAIFAEKAAVIKGGDVVFGRLDGLEAAAVEVCRRSGARPWFLGREFSVFGEPAEFSVTTPTLTCERLRLPTAALYQRDNAALAVMAVERLLGRLDADAVRAGLAAAVVPGRLQVVAGRPLLVADGAHNPDGIAVLAASLAALAVPAPRVALAAIMRDKDVGAMLDGLVTLCDTLVCTQASQPRSLPASRLAAAAREAAARGRATCRVRAVADPRRALAEARRLATPAGSVLVTGSLYLLEDLRDAAGLV
jgi:dihydrofolate synthase/folylpolyglutamate synthase